MIKKISKPVIDKWNNTNALIESVSLGNPISMAIYKGKEKLREGLIKTYPIQTARKYLQKLYDFDDSQLTIFKDNVIEKLRVVIPNKLDFSNKIKKAMDLCGYFCSRTDNYPHVDGWIYLLFEPKHQEEVNNYVRSMKHIYHVTPTKFLKKIQKIGLIPTFKNTFFSYPERIYFFIEETHPQEIYSLRNQMRINDNEQYCLLIIDVNKIPENVNFFIDPNYEYGIYTPNNIPPQAIIEVYNMI